MQRLSAQRAGATTAGPRSFSLGSVFWFVLAVSAFCAQIVVAQQSNVGGSFFQSVIPWFLLAVFYFRSKNQKRVFGVHLFVTILVVAMGWHAYQDSPLIELLPSSFLCATFVSFPVSMCCVLYELLAPMSTDPARRSQLRKLGVSFLALAPMLLIVAFATIQSRLNQSLAGNPVPNQNAMFIAFLIFLAAVALALVFLLLGLIFYRLGRAANGTGGHLDKGKSDAAAK